MTTTEKFFERGPDLYEEISDPFEEENEEVTVVVDMMDHAGIKGEAIRVELRRTRDPAMAVKRAKPSFRIPDDNFLIGLLDSGGLPKEGEHFDLPYHSCNRASVFGVLHSEEPIRALVEENGCFYFETSEGQWRLKILDTGN